MTPGLGCPSSCFRTPPPWAKQAQGDFFSSWAFQQCLKGGASPEQGHCLRRKPCRCSWVDMGAADVRVSARHGMTGLWLVPGGGERCVGFTGILRRSPGWCEPLASPVYFSWWFLGECSQPQCLFEPFCCRSCFWL